MNSKYLIDQTVSIYCGDGIIADKEYDTIVGWIYLVKLQEDSAEVWLCENDIEVKEI